MLTLSAKPVSCAAMKCLVAFRTDESRIDMTTNTIDGIMMLFMCTAISRRAWSYPA